MSLLCTHSWVRCGWSDGTNTQDIKWGPWFCERCLAYKEGDTTGG